MALNEAAKTELAGYMKEVMTPLLKDVGGPILKDLVEAQFEKSRTAPAVIQAMNPGDHQDTPEEAKDRKRQKGMVAARMIRALAAAKMDVDKAVAWSKKKLPGRSIRTRLSTLTPRVS
jgi:hypothetical protein